jgi:hypothetical protein
VEVERVRINNGSRGLKRYHKVYLGCPVAPSCISRNVQQFD